MQAGRRAEELVLSWLRENPQVAGVEDMRDLRVMREADVDCGIKLYDGRICLAEIKSDYNLGVSGNIAFEFLRINHTAHSDASVTLGWSARSPAKWLFMYGPQVHAIYQIEFADYRATVQKHTREKDASVKWIRTDEIKTTLIFIVPEAAFTAMKKHVLR